MFIAVLELCILLTSECTLVRDKGEHETKSQCERRLREMIEFLNEEKQMPDFEIKFTTCITKDPERS